MAKIILIAKQSDAANLPAQTAEILDADLALWEKLGYKYVRDIRVIDAPVAQKPEQAEQPKASKKLVIKAEEQKDEPVIEQAAAVPSLSSLNMKSDIVDVLMDTPFNTVEKLSQAKDEELLAIEAIGPARLKQIRDALNG